MAAATTATTSYKDASAAIDWLKNAFGFQEVRVYLGEDGVVAHAQLRLNPEPMDQSPPGAREQAPSPGLASRALWNHP
ncbi:hypothetical protein [Actinoallomurus sp. NPDC050550]|uniref:hypothetical protein n=1 Tax=Actinoallomurus sp. NPDC050550 TaxID=3154937 RepID=UPI0033EF5347